MWESQKKNFIILHLISSSSDNTIPLFLANEDNREAFLNKVHLVRRISSIQQFPVLLILFFSFSFFHKNRPIKEKTVKVKKGAGSKRARVIRHFSRQKVLKYTREQPRHFRGYVIPRRILTCKFLQIFHHDTLTYIYKIVVHPGRFDYIIIPRIK